MYVCVSDHPYYVGVQYHPEYLSRPLCPSPPYLGLILASCDKLQPYLANGCRFSAAVRGENFPMFDNEDISHHEHLGVGDVGTVPDYTKVNGVLSS